MCCKAAPIPDFLEWDAGCCAAVGDTSRPPRMRWCFCWWPMQVTLGCCKWWKAQIEGRCKVVRGKNMWNAAGSSLSSEWGEALQGLLEVLLSCRNTHQEYGAVLYNVAVSCSLSRIGAVQYQAGGEYLLTLASGRMTGVLQDIFMPYKTSITPHFYEISSHSPNCLVKPPVSPAKCKDTIFIEIWGHTSIWRQSSVPTSTRKVFAYSWLHQTFSSVRAGWG